MPSQQNARWGMFDSNNGIFYMMDDMGINVGLISDGNNTVVAKNNFNMDNQILFDPAQRTTYMIKFGYGNADFVMRYHDTDTNQYVTKTVHRFESSNALLNRNLNLPLSVELNANESSVSNALYVGKRQFSFYGSRSCGAIRYNSTRRETCHISSIDLFTTILSIRKKSSYLIHNVVLKQLCVVATSDQILQLRINSTLSGASFSGIGEQDAQETAIEKDTSATSSSGMLLRSCIVCPDLINKIELNIPLIEDQHITISSKGITSTAGYCTCMLTWTEEW
jgi:hypothetical protein